MNKERDIISLPEAKFNNKFRSLLEKINKLSNTLKSNQKPEQSLLNEIDNESKTFNNFLLDNLGILCDIHKKNKFEFNLEDFKKSKEQSNLKFDSLDKLIGNLEYLKNN